MREDRRELLRVRDGVRKARNEFKKRALTSVRSLKVKRSREWAGARGARVPLQTRLDSGERRNDTIYQFLRGARRPRPDPDFALALYLPLLAVS